MSLWLKNADLDLVDPPVDERLDIDETDRNEDELLIEEYQLVVNDMETYGWLINRLRRESRISISDLDVIGSIGRQIASSLATPQKLSRKTSPTTKNVKFKLDWDPVGFLEEQNFGVNFHEAIESVLTLTGSIDNAQLLTSAQYMKQTWPVTGQITLRFITDLVQGGSNSTNICRQLC
jgi:hypothetical protein